MTFLKPLLDQAIARGVTEETFVAILLLPLVATFVSATRYLVGIRGLGIFTPVLLAAVLWQAGINPGLYLFLFLLLVMTLFRHGLSQFKVHYLVRVALLFGFVCLSLLMVLLSLNYSLWPLLLLLFLIQDFLRIQIAQGFKSALRLSLETLLLGLIGMVILSLSFLNRLALNQPELVIIATVVLNFFIGRFAGLRLLEYRRFRKLLK